MKKLLHVGCGPQNKNNLKGFNNAEWDEIRFDIDENVSPDIKGTLTDLSLVMTSSIDAIYSSHNIEHLHSYQVPIALKEFIRVLKPEGFVVLTCPDLTSVCEVIIKKGLTEPVYVSPAGPISPIDILYGHREYVAQGNEFMAHKCGFTYSSLSDSFFNAGFSGVFGGSRPENFDLWIVAFKKKYSDDELGEIASSYLP